MRMSLGKRADYAIRAVLYLTVHRSDRRWHKARHIANEMEVPVKYLPQVMAPLSRAGLVRSESGPDGGYRLAAGGEEVSLLQVIEAVEGPMLSTECILRGGPCRRDDTCVVHGSWTEAQQAFRLKLETTTFTELAAVYTSLDDLGT